MDDWPRTDPAAACLILDFDGTLAPIVDDPEDSYMPEETARDVSRLAGVLGRVAIVSGRSAHFLQRRVGVTGVHLVGLYGLETVVEDMVEPDPRVRPHLSALEEARAAMPDIVADWPGAHLEDKGLALAVHWRRAEDREEAGVDLTRRVTRLVEGLAGDLTLEDGKMVIEVRPPVDADKGTAVAALAEGFDAVLYAGDDLGDLPAFAEVGRRDGMVVAVDHGRETDARVREAAGLVVEGTRGFAAWLKALADRLDDGDDPTPPVSRTRVSS